MYIKCVKDCFLLYNVNNKLYSIQMYSPYCNIFCLIVITKNE